MELLVGEEYKIIDEAPNYIVTNFGRVFNRITDRPIKPYICGKSVKNYHCVNYYQIVIYNHGKRLRFKLHRLVATYFIPCTGFNPDGTKIKGKIEINHIDENPFNNHVDNLEWCDHYYNNKMKSKNKYTMYSIEELVTMRSTCVYGTKDYHSLNSTICRRRQMENNNA